MHKRGWHNNTGKTVFISCVYFAHVVYPLFYSLFSCYIFAIPISGRSGGLALGLNVEQDDYVGSYTRSVGFQVLVHDPDIKPFLISNRGVHIAPNTRTEIGIKETNVCLFQLIIKIFNLYFKQKAICKPEKINVQSMRNLALYKELSANIMCY